MIILYTTERDYPWVTLRSTHASKVNLVLEEKSIPYRMEKGREGLRSRDLPYPEKVLATRRSGSYLCGEFSLADPPHMALAMVLEVGAMALGDFPQVERYLQALRERPSYRAISARTKVAEASARS